MSFFWYCFRKCWLRSEIMLIGNSEVLMLKLIVVRALKHPLLWQLLTSSFFLLNCSTIHQLLHSCSSKLPYTMSTFEDIYNFVYLYNSAQLLNYSLFINYMARKRMMAVVTKFQILTLWSQTCWSQTMFMIKWSRLQLKSPCVQKFRTHFFAANFSLDNIDSNELNLTWSNWKYLRSLIFFLQSDRRSPVIHVNEFRGNCIEWAACEKPNGLLAGCPIKSIVIRATLWQTWKQHFVTEIAY